MTPRVIEAVPVGGYVVRLQFSDGTRGDVNLSGELEGEIFAPLKDPAFFGQLRVHPELHTVVWPNGADLAPEFLYEKLQIAS